MWRVRQAFEAEVISKTWDDDNFKQRLLEDPKTVVEELSGEALPKQLKVTVFQETSTSVCLVIPKNPNEELDEHELEQVAGGISLGADELARVHNNVFTRLK